MPESMDFEYSPLFDDRMSPAVIRDLPPSESLADRAQAGQYVFDSPIRLRVNLALATGRPLLVRGPSGSGKSMLARAVADRAGWNFAERAIGSQTQAQDLLYDFDQLKRLQDAQRGDLKGDERPYLRPGPLYWAFNAAHAENLLKETGRPGLVPKELKRDRPWVVLLDEIDKADPDVPNNLLVPLGRLAFEIPEIGIVVETETRQVPLLVLTTNEERELPPAFLRRCIELVIEEPDRDQLVRIAKAHKFTDGALDLAALANLYETAPRPTGQRRNAAEFLDFVRAWQQLELKGDPETRKAVLEAISGRA
jgi:MoxR-like ATPase